MVVTTNKDKKQLNMKKTFVSLISVFIAILSYAQNEITLTTSAEGTTKEEAVHNALRSAIEQTYGTFISSNTTILNDEIVKDEIVSISSGTVNSYEEISYTTLKNGNSFVTIKAEISLSGLRSFAQSRGATVEFAGATLAHKSMLIDLNKKNEIIVVRNLLSQLIQFPKLCDYKLEVSEPKWSEYENAYELEILVQVLVNKNLITFHNLIHSTLAQLSLSREEREDYRNLGYSVDYINWGGETYYLRNQSLAWALEPVFDCILMNDFEKYIVKNGTVYQRGHNAWAAEPVNGNAEVALMGAGTIRGYEGFYRKNKGAYFSKLFANPLGIGRLKLRIPKEDLIKYSTFEVSPISSASSFPLKTFLEINLRENGWIIMRNGIGCGSIDKSEILELLFN